ncbi:MAG: hypothetical protein Q9187_002720 [Circinaria calcarea]
MASSSSTQLTVPPLRSPPQRTFSMYKFMNDMVRCNEPLRLTREQCERELDKVLNFDETYRANQELWLNQLYGPRMRRFWANLHLFRMLYPLQNVPSFELSFYEPSKRPIKRVSNHVFIFDTKKIVHLPYFYMGTRFEFLDFSWWRSELRSCNRQLPLTDQEVFLVWEHMIRIDYSEAHEYDKKAAIECAWSEPEARKWFKKSKKLRNTFVQQGKPDTLPASCIPSKDILKEAKLQCHVIMIPQSFEASIARKSVDLSNFKLFRLSALVLNHPKIPSRAQIGDAYRAIVETKIKLMVDSTQEVRAKILDKCLKQTINQESDQYWQAIQSYTSHSIDDIQPPPLMKPKTIIIKVKEDLKHRAESVEPSKTLPKKRVKMEHNEAPRQVRAASLPLEKKAEWGELSKPRPRLRPRRRAKSNPL